MITVGILELLIHYAEVAVWTTIGSLAVLVVMLLCVGLYFKTLWPRG